MAHGVRFGVMPCCHKDHGGSVKAAAAATGVPLGVAMDFMLMGRAAERGFWPKLVTIDPAITPHNRLVLGLPRAAETSGAVAAAEAKLAGAYRRAHNPKPPRPPRGSQSPPYGDTNNIAAALLPQ